MLLALPVVIALADRQFGRDAFGDALKVAWGFARASSDFPAVIKLAAVLEWVGFAAAAVVLLVLRLRGRLGANAFAALAIGLPRAAVVEGLTTFRPDAEHKSISSLIGEC